jgi:hypothetical protein
MRSKSRYTLPVLAAASLLVVSTGCYHAVVETGLEPAATAYHEKWEASWFIGLVPARVEATNLCGGPWARVETQQSFLNGLVSFLTLGIYSPHEVKVVCAAQSIEDGSVVSSIGDSERHNQ